MTPREKLCRLIHDVLVGDTADEMIHAPWQKSWVEPSMPRWEQWGELADAILSRYPVSAPSGEEVEGLAGQLADLADIMNHPKPLPLADQKERSALVRQAASAIRSQAGRIAELEGALTQAAMELDEAANIIGERHDGGLFRTAAARARSTLTQPKPEGDDPGEIWAGAVK